MTEGNTAPTLLARRVRFFSPNDEAAFFEWLGKIPCVTAAQGSGDTVYITVDPAAVDDERFMDLFALFRRFGVDREQLRPFDPGRFESWFAKASG